MDIKQIKRLRELTGVGITDAKKALVESKGDFDKALESMRVKGLSKADKKAERETRVGVIDSYLHDGRIGVLVEVNCETDFVARTDDFKQLTHDLAMHIAASLPTYVGVEDVPKRVLDKERELFKAELKNQGKPAKIIDKIVKGKIEKFYTEACLLKQPFVKDPDQTVEAYIKSYIAKLGENITVRRFSRLEIGEA